MELQTISVQGSGVWNEDALIVHKAAQLYGVADGATSLLPFRGPGGETGGRMASQLLKSYFEGIGPEDERNLEQLLREANRLLGVEMVESGIQVDEKDQLWTSGAAIVRIREHYIEYVQSGDCMIMAAYADGSIRTVTRDHVAHIDQEAKMIWKQAVHRGIQSRDELWELVKPLIVQNKARMNTDHGYSVLNGRPEAEHFIEYGKINRIQLTGLLLHTDGLYYPEEENGDGAIPAREMLMKKIADSGLEAYAEWLIGTENDDPECIRYPRFKKSDDKSGIYVSRMNE
ncbi:hypothetical protein D3C75_137760 [compost metagenome]